jgi:hypothetical protein
MELSPLGVETLQRQKIFWERGDCDAPILGLYLQRYVTDDIFRVAGDGEYLFPENLKAEMFDDLFWERQDQLKRAAQDLIRPAEPINTVPWMEGILGLKLLVQGRTIWAEPLLGKNEDIDTLNPHLDDRWLEATLQFVRDLVDLYSPEAPVTAPFLRGPADVVAAMLGVQRFCFELTEHPEKIRQLLFLCQEVWTQVYSEVLDIIPEWQGGYVVGGRWIYAPGHCAYFSEDASVLISPDMYRDIFLPVNMNMASRFHFGYIHRHSASIHHIDVLLELPADWAIEITVDPCGPELEEILAMCQRIQEAGQPLILFGLEDPESFYRVMDALSPKGLCIIFHFDEPPTSDEFTFKRDESY